MADNIERKSGRPQNYKNDRGGTPTEFGPFIGVVKNNVDSKRSGQLQVYIKQFSTDPDDPMTWRYVNYLPPFYGTTEKTSTSTGVGTYPGNQQSYGMWFTPPDLNTSVLCFFVNGDPSQGYYVGCVPEIGLNHMIPAIGAVADYRTQNKAQEAYFAGAPQLPVTEINSDNKQIDDNARFLINPNQFIVCRQQYFFSKAWTKISNVALLDQLHKEKVQAQFMEFLRLANQSIQAD